MNASRSLATAVLLALALPSTAHAALNAYLKIDSIRGESTDAVHKEEIEVASWSFSTNIEASARPGGGASAAKACLSELVLVKPVDRASPPLLQAAMLGQHLRDATLTVRREGAAKAQDYLVIRMSDVLVTSVKQAGGGDSTLEEIALDFATLRMTYRAEDPKGAVQPVEASVSDCGGK